MAARAFDHAAIKLHGRRAQTNFSFEEYESERDLSPFLQVSLKRGGKRILAVAYRLKPLIFSFLSLSPDTNRLMTFRRR